MKCVLSGDEITGRDDSEITGSGGQRYGTDGFEITLVMRDTPESDSLSDLYLAVQQQGGGMPVYGDNTEGRFFTIQVRRRRLPMVPLYRCLGNPIVNPFIFVH